MDVTSAVGTAASIVSVISFAPQAWKIIKTRETKSISTKMYVLTVTGFALWLMYGLGLGAWPLIASNGLCLILSTFILVMKLLPQNRKEAVARQLDPENA